MQKSCGQFVDVSDLNLVVCYILFNQSQQKHLSVSVVSIGKTRKLAVKPRLCSTIDVKLLSVICSLLLSCISDMTCRSMQHRELGQNSQEQMQDRLFSYILYFISVQT